MVSAEVISFDHAKLDQSRRVQEMVSTSSGAVAGAAN
jgi:hypothetical protein